MIEGYQNKQLQLNRDLRKFPKGSIIKIETDKDGVPIDRYWRDRLKDSKIDKCVKILSKKELEDMEEEKKRKAIEEEKKIKATKNSKRGE